MRYAAAALALAFASNAFAGHAQAEDRAITLNYEIELAGTFGFRVDTVTRLADDRYSADADVSKQGVLSAFTSSFHAVINSRGRFGANLINAATGGGQLKAGDEDRRFTFTYGPDGQVVYASQPELEVKTGREIGDDQRRGSLDPLSAAVAAFLTRPDPCSRPIAIYDGRHRFDLLVDNKGMEKVPEAATMGIKDKGLRCDVRMKRVAGYKSGSDGDTEFKRPARLWLAKLDDSGRFYPVRVEIDIGIGSVVAHLVKFDARPLTADEKASLAK